jgi:hypothetical protein
LCTPRTPTPPTTQRSTSKFIEDLQAQAISKQKFDRLAAIFESNPDYVLD